MLPPFLWYHKDTRVVVLSTTLFRLASFSFLFSPFTPLSFSPLYKSVVSFAQNAPETTMPSRRRPTSKGGVLDGRAPPPSPPRIVPPPPPHYGPFIRALRLREKGQLHPLEFQSTIVRRAITGGFTIDATEKQFSRAWNGGVNCVEIHPSKNVGERFVLVGTVDGSVVVYDAMHTQGPVFTSNRRFGSRRRAAGNARRRNDDDDDNASAENGFARHPLVQTSEGHDKSVSSVAWYPEDANAFFSASFDGTVKVWDASRVEVVATYASSVHSVSTSGRRNVPALATRIRDVSLSLSSHLNNDLVAVATDEPDVKLWDPGSNVVGMTLPKAHPGGCSKTAWSKENSFSVITCGFEGRCVVWDARRCVTPLFSMDRRRSNSEESRGNGGSKGGESGSWSSLRKPIEFYDETARAHADGIESVLIHPNGRSVFTKGFGFRNDARVREWDLRTGRCDATKFERFSKTSSSSQNVRGSNVINDSSGRGSEYRYSTTMACSEDGVNIFVPLQDGSIFVYDSRTGAILERLKCHADRVTSVQFAARECELFSSSLDGFLVRWKSKNTSAMPRTMNANSENGRDWVSDEEEEDEDIGVGMYRNVRARR